MKSLIKLAVTVLVLGGAVTARADLQVEGLNLPGGCAISGRDDAPITIEEFVDFECPYCARGVVTMAQIQKNYPNQVRLVVRNMPLAFHPSGVENAKAFSAICLQSPSFAYQFQKELFGNQDLLEKQGKTFLFRTALKIGADVDRMRIDMEGNEVRDVLRADEKAVAQNNFTGAPSFVIGTEKVVGSLPYRNFIKIIDRQKSK